MPISDTILPWSCNTLLAPYTTYKIGGPAKRFLILDSIKTLQQALLDCSKWGMPFYVLGKGSNTLFDDRGYNGAVLLNQMQDYSFKEGYVEAESGLSFAWLGQYTAKQNYGGLEFAAGIPGSVGGAIYMNAGANAQEVSQVVEAIDFVDVEGKVQKYTQKDLQFKYRWSCFQKVRGVIAKAYLKLSPNIHARDIQKQYLAKRGATQPLKDPSCGCVFRNLDHQAIGAIIEEMGLKGKKIGGAQISTIHGNFIVNKGGAKAQDVLDLVTYLENAIHQKTHKPIEREMRYIPYEESQ